MIAHAVHGTGPDVVLLHGVGLDHTMWDRCVPALSASGRVITVDLRGHGASGAAAPGTSLTDLATDVLEVLDSLAVDRAHVVGFSLGALVAAHLAIHHPDRIRTLALVSSVAHRTPEEQQAVGLRLEAAERELKETVDAAISRWFDGDWSRREPELVEQVRHTMLGNDRESYLACYRVFCRADQEVGPLLNTIAAPTLAITGSEDPGSTPDMSHRLGESIPDAWVEIVEGARHLLPLERPHELTNALTKYFERIP